MADPAKAGSETEIITLSSKRTIPVKTGINRVNRKYENNMFQRAYTFLPFFFSTRRHPPELAVGVIFASWLSIVIICSSLSDSEPSVLWDLFIPLISICNSLCGSAMIGPVCVEGVFTAGVCSCPI